MSIARNGVNNTVIKPTIYLIGTKVNGNSYSQLIDNDIHTYASTGLSFSSKTQLDEDNVLSFNSNVRIIITGQMTPKPTYQQKDGDGSLGSLSFEGNKTYDSQTDDVNFYAETWFTLNEKEPVRTSAQFYNFTDMDDREIVDNVTHIPGETISDPSSIVVNPSSETTSTTDNLDSLGFVLKLSPTGSPLITLKARTYFRGEVSKTAVAVFKLVYPVDTNKVYQNTWASS